MLLLLMATTTTKKARTVKLGFPQTNPCNGRAEISAFTPRGTIIESCDFENKDRMIDNLEEDGWIVTNKDKKF